MAKKKTAEPEVQPIRLADVARLAGVAVGTASRVLNNAANVNPDSRRRVMEVVEKLDYRRLRVRRNTRGGLSQEAESAHNIGVVLLGMDESLVHLPVLSAVLHGVEASVTGNNGNLLFANLPKGDRVPPFFANGQLAGLIVKTSQYGALPDPETNPLVRAIMRLPVVWVWARPEGAPGDLVGFNQETAAQLAATHLFGHGHRRVAFLNPKKGKTSLEHIKKEFRFACENCGLSLTVLESVNERMSVWPEPALTGPDELLPLIDRWLAIPRDQRPTAFFVPADNISIQVIAALNQRNMRVGRDISLISLNNESSLIQATNPTLTTIDVNAQRIGVRCVEQLLWRINHPEDRHLRQTILLEPFIVPGSSVASI